MIASIVIAGGPDGRERETRKPVRLPAERQRRGAVSIFKHAGRRLARRDLVAGIVSRVRSGSDASALNHGRSAPLNFSGSARVQLRQKSPRRIADRFQVNHSLRDAPASEMQEITGARSCPTQGGSDPTRNRSSV